MMATTLISSPRMQSESAYGVISIPQKNHPSACQCIHHHQGSLKWIPCLIYWSRWGILLLGHSLPYDGIFLGYKAPQVKISFTLIFTLTELILVVTLVWQGLLHLHTLSTWSTIFCFTLDLIYQSHFILMIWILVLLYLLHLHTYTRELCPRPIKYMPPYL